jgi:hypothetical protein
LIQATDTRVDPAGPTLRDNMAWLADTFAQPLGEADDAGLALRIGRCLTATIAPGRQGRLVALFDIGLAERIPPVVWISALSEAAGWGLAGERQRFAVVDGHFTLLWTTPPLPRSALEDQLWALMATAMALAEAAQHGLADDSPPDPSAQALNAPQAPDQVCA